MRATDASLCAALSGDRCLAALSLPAKGRAFPGAVDSGLENGRGMGTNGGISDSFADTFNLS